MSGKIWQAIYFGGAISLFFVQLLQQRFPAVGDDFDLWIYSFFAGKWHFLHYGLRPLRFTPFLGGGIPIYGEPHDFYYSPLQLFALFFDPWIAILATTVLMVTFGYVGWYLFSMKVMKLPSMWSHLLSTILTVHGFYVMHLLVAHYWIFGFFMTGWIAWLIFDNEVTRLWSWITRTAAFTMIVGFILYFAGFLSLFYTAFFIVLVMPVYLLLLFEKSGGRACLRACGRIYVYALAATLICASKFVAIFSLMRFFPRHASVPIVRGNIWDFLFRIYWSTSQDPNTFDATNWFVHEKSMHISYVILLGIILSIGVVPRIFKKAKSAPIIACLVLFFGLLSCQYVIELISGEGLLATATYQLPMFNKLRVATRFGYTLSLLIIPFSIWVLYTLSLRLKRHTQTVLVFLFFVATLMSFFIINSKAVDILLIPNRYESYLLAWQEANAYGFKNATVQQIAEEPNFIDTAGISIPYELIPNKQRNILTIGSVDKVTQQEFNLLNPVCFQYPEDNGCLDQFQTFHGSEEVFLRAFSEGGYIKWKLSKMQYTADIVSSITLITGLCTLILYLLFLKIHAVSQ